MAISFEKQASGKVTLTKGEGRVLLRKSAEPLRATASWPPHTDYDVYALLVMRDGSTRAVAMFGAEGQPARLGQRQLVPQERRQFRHAVRAHRGQRRVEALRQQRAHLVELLAGPSVAPAVAVLLEELLQARHGLQGVRRFGAVGQRHRRQQRRLGVMSENHVDILPPQF